jgi:hypothetical protein
MKTKVSFISRMMALAVAMVMTSSVVFADGEITDVFTSGKSTNPKAGEFVVRATDDVFHYQGQEYEVYKVFYEDPAMNMKIAVNNDGKCKSFIAYTSEYIMFYDCTRQGFGVRKVMFNNPEVHKYFSHEEYQDQTVLSKNKRIEKKHAVDLIAAFLPGMQTI